MTEENRYIKTFEELMAKRKYHKSLSHIVIAGKTKRSLFRRQKNFELHIYYTPAKKIILDIICEPIDISEINIDFKVYDPIQNAIDWCDKNGHEIVFELNR